MSLVIGPMPDDVNVRLQFAQWAVKQWAQDFPDDTVDWYLNLYKEADSATAIPFVRAALVNGEFVGTGSLIADDELPGASQLGPWVATVFVAEFARRQGIGEAIVKSLVTRAQELDYPTVFLYTHHNVAWYQQMGWAPICLSYLGGHEVTVMSLQLKDL